jgi:hypothetical protein
MFKDSYIIMIMSLAMIYTDNSSVKRIYILTLQS